MKIHKIYFLLLLMVLSFSVSAFDLSNWSKNENDGFTTYVPKDLGARGTFYVKSFPIEKGGNIALDDWFNEKVNVIQADLGKPTKRFNYQETQAGVVNKHGSYYDSSGKKLYASYLGGTFNSGNFYLIQLVTSLDAETVDKYNDQAGKIIKAILRELASRKKVVSASPENAMSKNNTVLSTNPLKKPAAPEGLIGIWGLLSYGMQAGGFFGSSEDAIAVFKNGAVTTDIAGVFNLGVNQSKSQEPQKWGLWRMQGESIEIKWANDTSYDEHTHWWKNKKVGEDQRLEGCFARLSSSSGGAGGIAGVTVGASKTWCFDKSGRFSNKKNSFGSAPNVSTSTKSAIIGGRYRVDGNAMTLAYDSGETITVGFATMSDERNHIGINGVRYLGR